MDLMATVETVNLVGNDKNGKGSHQKVFFFHEMFSL